ncbi:LAFA_0D12926g1_1 [Lachancea sp. 'fantastica']|nr:LAFA_0D12926g1_1 [Lachancea sp. 'fantastica']
MCRHHDVNTKYWRNKDVFNSTASRMVEENAILRDFDLNKPDVSLELKIGSAGATNHCIDKDANFWGPTGSNYSLKASQYLQNVEEYASNPSSGQFGIFCRSLSRLYRAYLWKHQVQKIKDLAKLNMRAVIKLLEIQDYESAKRAILLLFNETSPSSHSTLDHVLKADFTTYNDHYLGALKILVLQTLIRSKGYQQHEHTIIQIFERDARYLLRMSKSKVPSLLKLVLSFYSIFVDFKVLFGIKVLQYVRQFDLNFVSYVKNMTLQQFQSQVQASAQRSLLKSASHLAIFYADYSRIFTSSDKLMLPDLIGNTEASHTSKVSSIMNELLVASWSRSKKIFSQPLSLKEQSSLIDSVETNISEKVSEVPKTAALLLNFMEFANTNFSSGLRQVWRLIDKITLFLNTHLSRITLHVLKELIFSTSEFCVNNGEIKRLLNIANVAFNGFVVHNVGAFLMEATRLDLLGQMFSEHEEMNLAKLERFLTSASAEHQILLLEKYFSIFTFFKFDKLSQITRAVGKFSRCFKCLKNKPLQELKGASELMLCLLNPNLFPDLGSIEHWSPLTQMIFETQRGCMNRDNILNRMAESLDPLRPYTTLIKTTFALELETRADTSLKLARITDVYIERWVKRAEGIDEALTALELSLIHALFGVLRFNRFYSKMMTLANALLSQNGNFYEKCQTYSQRQWIIGRAGLRLDDHNDSTIPCLQTVIDVSTAGATELTEFLDIELQSIEKDLKVAEFNQLFAHDLPRLRSEVFDTANARKMPTRTYVKFLLLSIKTLCTSSVLQRYCGNLQDALVDSKRALKLCQTLLRKLAHIDQEAQWEIFTSLCKTYKQIVDIYAQASISRDCEFYVEEFLKVCCSTSSPIVIFDCLNICLEYYRLTGQEKLADALLRKANDTYKRIDNKECSEAKLWFLFDNDEKECLTAQLNIMQTTNRSLYNAWSLKLGNTLSNAQISASHSKVNDMNKSKILYESIVHQLDADPFFRSLKDVVSTVPSSVTAALQAQSALPRCNNNSTPVKSKLPLCAFSSPRPSSLTPRSKPLKQSFDSARTIRDFKKLKLLVETLDLEGLKIFETREISDLYSLSLSLLSSTDATKLSGPELNHNIALHDIPRYLPLKFDRMFSAQGNEIYGSFKPKAILQANHLFRDHMDSLQNILSEKSQILDTKFDVIGIDVCGATGDLLLSKMDFETESICVRLPLGRQSSRDVDESVLSFNDAIAEMNDVISANNKSTAIEVTSKINTKEERKEWWQHRYGLDSRLSTMLKKIESSWFGGFKAFFKQSIVEQQHLDNFRLRFEEVLQRTLPTRKQFKSPNSFFRIGDAVLALFLKLDPLDADFADSMEDLIFFVFDLLLFHGEQNAYDEIDTAFLHIQLEELIHEYRKNGNQAAKLSHTFLIVSGAGHLIPWESLSFLSGNSVSRLPSIQTLVDVIKTGRNTLSPRVQLDKNLSVVLDPQGDLLRTRNTFKDVFADWNANIPQSKVVVGEKPQESQLLDMLSDSKLFIYMGHGGGEQYVRLKKIKQLDSAAPSFLLGCSSAYMETKGRLESSGVVYSYLLGGSPMVLGNLWDVTDKDIDKFSSVMFHELGIMGQSSSDKSVSEAVSIARSSCHLRYLNGAAPVVYGLPLKFGW